MQACEEALAELSTVERLQTPWQRDAHRLRCFVRDQLKQAGVEASGHAWGAEREPTAPKCALCPACNTSPCPMAALAVYQSHPCDLRDGFPQTMGLWTPMTPLKVQHSQMICQYVSSSLH